MKVLLCPLNDPGYLYPALAVGRELRRRAHAVHVLAAPQAAPVVAAAGLAVSAAGDGTALSVAHWTVRGPEQHAVVARAVRLLRPDVLVTSVLCHGALVAAEAAGLPVVVLGLTAHLWPYRGGAGPVDAHGRAWRLAETLKHYGEVREAAGLAPRHDRFPDTALLGTAFLLRGHPLLEAADAELPPAVRHVGPCWWEPEPPAVEPLPDSRPLAYVHLGRTFGGTSLWPRLNAAFTSGTHRAVVELGRSGAPDADRDADLVVGRRPWMGPLVERADLVLTNATSAPVLAALLHGKPLLVAPNGSEQQVLAAGCLRAGVARMLPEPGASAADLRAAVEETARDAELRACAEELGGLLADGKSETRAADAVESAAR
ncbi:MULTISPECIES: glycosyltransferase [unclassified Streptomyces]|uniref:glycosyltransferase n=1 Tax=unclassified Streptomyces TaxID=2593676 RepID=UPI0020256599|nr:MULTISPECIES: glycosyltransferase [unclassified Streptomyces]MCX4553516.1 glycosyltransferase [Streptomyces sp. NBC_01500]WSV52509.1 glycosyltransferase [Streptomyces sp. NBC_01014]